MIKDFTISADQNHIDAIKQKVRDYQWHEMPMIDEGGDRWIYGTDMDYLKQLCAYWVDGYDWRVTQNKLNEMKHFTTMVDDLSIHFIHEKSAFQNAKTLCLTHGWPGSVLEFCDVIASLAHPEQFGGALEDGMNVIAPSLPGYGWSGKPQKPIGPRRTAQIWQKLISERLGYDSYIAQGGDWGSLVTAYLGLEHAKSQNGGNGGCEAIHINMFGLRPFDMTPQNDEEKFWINGAQMMMDMEGAYLRLQMTKPQTLSYAMMDSPVGVCAWMIEKFHRWSDKRGADGTEHIENAFDKDKLLGSVMIYLLTKSFNTAIWFYRGALEEGLLTMAEGQKINLPCGIALFPYEFITFPPRRLVENGYQVARWTQFEKGGHFAAMEQPEIFTQEIRDFVKQLG